MAASGNQAAFSPFVKCSTCGADVDATRMGRHICANPSPGGYVQTHPPFYQQHPYFWSSSAPQIHSPSTHRPKRPTLPRIDPYAPSRYGMVAGQLTPSSSGHGSYAASPRSTSSSRKSIWRFPSRKTPPAIITGLPTPELTNLDCAFPPFPNMPTSPSTPSSQEKPRRAKSRRPSRKSITESHYKYDGGSRRGSENDEGSGSTKRRLSTTSSKSHSRWKSLGGAKEEARPSTAGSMRRRPSFKNLFRLRKVGAEAMPPLPPPLPPLASPHFSDYIPTTPSPLTAIDTPVMETESTVEPLLPPTPNLRYGRRVDLGPSRAEARLKMSREASNATTQSSAQTIRRDSGVNAERNLFESHDAESKPVNRREPSYKAKRPPSIITARVTSSVYSFVISPTFPPQVEETNSGEDQNDSHDEHPSNYNESSNSDDEASMTDNSPDEDTSIPFSFRRPFRIVQPRVSEARKPTSPGEMPASPSPSAGQENCSKAALEFQMIEVVDQHPLPPLTISSAAVRSALASPHTSSNSLSSCGSSGSWRQPSSSRSSLPQQDETRRTRSSTGATARLGLQLEADLSPPVQIANVTQPDSPIDPSFQNGRLCSISSNATARAWGIDQLAEEIHLLMAEKSSTKPEDLKSEAEADSSEKAPHVSISHRAVRSSVKDKSKTTSHSTRDTNKGTCRGCQQIILAKEKSVSSADGRITGRYHKDCFACHKCGSAFATADFYVLNNHPYCAHHYHELNGTLCSGCGSGIEGHYLETGGSTTAAANANANIGGPKGRGSSWNSSSNNSKKFHLHCLSCTTCRHPLRDEYYDFNGRLYCERDALRIANVAQRSPHYDSTPIRSSPLAREMLIWGNTLASEGKPF